MSETNQAEHAQISTALEVEKIEDNLYRSKSLWVPTRARGVFGGQVISQALVSASRASPSTPIVYQVERLRQGRSYVACAVKAIQRGNIIFVLMCSFQKPEPWQPSYQWVMPTVPSSDECELEEDRFLRYSKETTIRPETKRILETFAEERKRSPIAIKMAKEHDVEGNGIRYMYWMQAKNIPKYEAPFQKCILGYLSDLYFIGAVPRIMGLKRYSKGPTAVGMTSTLDHSVYYYSDDFDCGDWLLYVMTCPRAASGRAVMHGQIFARNGKLVAITSQEGVARADIRGPDRDQVKAKL